MNFPTAAGEVETHKFQLSIVYHLLLFSVGVRRLPRSRFLASVMLSKDSTRTELGKRPIPTRRVGHTLNTITYRRSLLSRQPNSYHRGYRKDKREDNLVSHSLLLFGYSGNNQVTSSPGWDRHRTTRPGPRCVPPFFLFHYPLSRRTCKRTLIQTKRTSTDQHADRCMQTLSESQLQLRVTAEFEHLELQRSTATGDLPDARPVASHDHGDRPRICHRPHTQTLDYHCRHSMAIPGDGSVFVSPCILHCSGNLKYLKLRVPCGS